MASSLCGDCEVGAGMIGLECRRNPHCVVYTHARSPRAAVIWGGTAGECRPGHGRGMAGSSDSGTSIRIYPFAPFHSQSPDPFAMSTKKFDPEKAQNAPEIEKQFAVVAVEHAQTFWNLIGAVQPRELRLTKYDDEIYDHFSEVFPDLVKPPYTGLAKLDEDMMKSPEGKEKWRVFINAYEKKVENYNFGSLIRMDSSDEYSQFNSIFVTRMQFYAIEIARNRLGLNDAIHEKEKKEAAEKKEKDEKEKAAKEKAKRKRA